MTKCNFAGDTEAGASWTDKIMANKADAASSQAGGEGEGAAEDEWVRMASRASKIHMHWSQVPVWVVWWNFRWHLKRTTTFTRKPIILNIPWQFVLEITRFTYWHRSHAQLLRCWRFLLCYTHQTSWHNITVAWTFFYYILHEFHPIVW